MQAGSQAVQLIRPDGESGDLDMDVEQLIDSCIEHPHVCSVELQVRDICCYPSTKAITETFIAQGTPIGAMGGLALTALLRPIRTMRTDGRRLDFLGLMGTMLSDGAVSMIAGALNTPQARDPASEAETVEIL